MQGLEGGIFERRSAGFHLCPAAGAAFDFGQGELPLPVAVLRARAIVKPIMRIQLPPSRSLHAKR